MSVSPPGSFLSLPELHLSRPGVAFPDHRVDNAETIRRVRERFKGSTDEFAALAAAIEHVFGLCKTQVRYIEPNVRPGSVADLGVRAVNDCLEENGVSLDEVDLVICGSIARQYFEP